MLRSRRGLAQKCEIHGIVWTSQFMCHLKMNCHVSRGSPNSSQTSSSIRKEYFFSTMTMTRSPLILLRITLNLSLLFLYFLSGLYFVYIYHLIYHPFMIVLSFPFSESMGCWWSWRRRWGRVTLNLSLLFSYILSSYLYSYIHKLI